MELQKRFYELLKKQEKISLSDKEVMQTDISLGVDKPDTTNYIFYKSDVKDFIKTIKERIREEISYLYADETDDIINDAAGNNLK